MMRVTVPAKGFDFVMEQQLLKKGVRRGLISAAHRGVETVRVATLRAPPASKNGSRGAVDTGAYRRAWTGRAAATAGGSYEATLDNAMPYAGVIEHGLRPGSWPDLAGLTMWVLRKLRKSLRAKGADARRDEARAIANRIRFAIHRRGLLPRLVATNSNKRLTSIARSEVRRELLLVAFRPR